MHSYNKKVELYNKKVDRWNKIHTFFLVIAIVIIASFIIVRFVSAGDYHKRHDSRRDYYSTFEKNIRFYTIYDGEHIECIRFPNLNNSVACFR